MVSIEWFSGPRGRGDAKEMAGRLLFPAAVQALGSQDVSSPLTWACRKGRHPSGCWERKLLQGFKCCLPIVLAGLLLDLYGAVGRQTHEMVGDPGPVPEVGPFGRLLPHPPLP